MIPDNLSRLFLNDSLVPQNFQLTVGQLVGDWCAQMDRKIMLGIVAILSLYVFRIFVVRKGARGWKSLLPSGYHDVVDRCVEYFESFLDTAALISVLFVLWVFWAQQQLSSGMVIWLVILGVICVVSFGGDVVEKWRERRLKRIRRL